MPLNLACLSNDSICKIIEKMSRKSMCRLRRASKTIDLIAEENRVFLSKTVKSDILTLKIIFNGADDQMILDDVIYKVYNCNDRYEILEEVITDPYSQLSAQWFKMLILEFSRSSLDPKNKKKTSAVRLNLCDKIVIPVLLKMRISCSHFLYISHKSLYLKVVSPLVNFSSIEIRSPLELKWLIKLPILNCLEVEFAHVIKTDQKLSTVLRHFSIPKVNIDFKNIIPTNFEAYIKEFLEDVRIDSKAKGNVEQLKMFHVEGIVIVPEGGNFIFRTESPAIEIVPRKISNYIFTVHLNDGGMAVVVSSNEFTEISFVSDNGQETLFHSVAPYFFPYTPYDVSSVFDEFLANKSPMRAFDSLLRGFKADYLYKR